jgi:magnesium chelatase family protein
MLIKLWSAAAYGIETVGVSVEVNIAARGFPGFEIVGLPHKSVAESRERVKTAIQNSGIDFPSGKKIIVNLAPADLPKEGSFYDLPIAVGIVSAVKGIKVPGESLFFGELSLDGTLRHTRGALLLSIFAKENGFRSLYVPKDSANEASAVSGVEVYAPENFGQLVSHLSDIKGTNALHVHEVDLSCRGGVSSDKDPLGNVGSVVDFSEISGQEQAKRALEISAAGGHNIILIGSPGVGKSMMAKAFQSILPPLAREESMEVTKVYSAAGMISAGESLIVVRPFRAPHHTISYAGLIGGGACPKPGEASLAHRGVLFLDEFSEFNRYSLESLRQPLEAGEVTVSRSHGSVKFPSRFTLLAASNPCPCGYLYHPKVRCRCTPPQIERYRKKLSGPVLDRIDLQVLVRSSDFDALSYHKVEEKDPTMESSFKIRERVLRAREFQKERFSEAGIFTNSEMSNKLIRRYCPLSKEAVLLMSKAGDKFNLSARAYFKVLKVARTIADLSASEGSGGSVLSEAYVAEALQYRFTV